MELTYLTPAIKSATNDGETAQQMLGNDLARSFHGLIADMRNAMYLGEMPDEPTIMDGTEFGLNYPLGDSAVLQIEPVGVGAIDGSSWQNVHRVKLLRILSNGEVLV
ncbi:hypothetical protein OF122_12600 [Pelagibacterium flavum]|uniref:Uncharacterized protein n=1 Tax=Pelagibacterium flavum TaxID=2984530 RepID=A0ABY6IJY1_9HYPH|nr:hypothetical protein [Pelagibacterium sp. YIM 151497]UYQ70900.1 hypothetical protein OF122_12600 [Pelagibacterium sp. YIM 151497]